MIRTIRRSLWRLYIKCVHRNSPYCDSCEANHYIMDIEDPDYLDCWGFIRANELNEDRLDRIAKIKPKWYAY